MDRRPDDPGPGLRAVCELARPVRPMGDDRDGGGRGADRRGGDVPRSCLWGPPAANAGDLRDGDPGGHVCAGACLRAGGDGLGAGRRADPRRLLHLEKVAAGLDPAPCGRQRAGDGGDRVGSDAGAERAPARGLRRAGRRRLPDHASRARPGWRRRRDPGRRRRHGDRRPFGGEHRRDGRDHPRQGVRRPGLDRPPPRRPGPPRRGGVPAAPRVGRIARSRRCQAPWV